jgi:hypothetical protein
MILKVDLTDPQAEQLYWWLKAQVRESDVSPRGRALSKLLSAVESTQDKG